jgi:hypothetical protein
MFLLLEIPRGDLSGGDGGDPAMADEIMTYDHVLRELQIDEEELEELVRDGSLRPADSDEGPRFARAEVVALKDELEAMKTIRMDKTPEAKPPVPPFLRRPHSPDRTSQA